MPQGGACAAPARNKLLRGSSSHAAFFTVKLRTTARHIAGADEPSHSPGGTSHVPTHHGRRHASHDQGGSHTQLLQVAGPSVIPARGDTPVRIGLDNPLTGTYAALGKNELIGCQLAIEQINAKGGILSRQVELLSEDSTRGDAGTAVQKARKLIDRDNVNFLVGNVNSALALAMQPTSRREEGADGGARRPRTPSPARAATTTYSASATRRRWKRTLSRRRRSRTRARSGNEHRLDYVFGHTLQAGLDEACAANGGSKIGADPTLLGTTDYSSYLIKAQAANPDVIIFLPQGDDMINATAQGGQPGCCSTSPARSRNSKR